MKHKDSKIIPMRNMAEKEKNTDINKGVYIKDEYIEFERVEVIEEKMSIMLPKTFKDMSIETRKVKYPSENRPKVIKTNEDGTANFTFSLTEQELEESQLSEIIEGSKFMLNRIYPANEYYTEKEEDLGEIKIAWYDYKSSALDSDVYNVMFIAIIEKNLAVCTFNCLYEDMAEWYYVTNQVIKSIKDITKKGVK